MAEDVYLSCADFVAAGHLSNTWLIASGILRLLQNPDQLRALRLAPEKINQAVIELLRYEPPFQLVGRYAANATQVGGHAVAAGQRVVGVVGSANRDASVLSRSPRGPRHRSARHGQPLGFGEGMHYCIGAPLARMVVPAAAGARAAAARAGARRAAAVADDGPDLRALINLPLSFRPT